jgi:hypothetical protein
MLSKSKAIPLTDTGGPYGCETSTFPHFLDSRLIDGGEVVSFTPLSPIVLRKTPATHFCLRLSRTQARNAAGRIRSIEKSNNVIENPTRDLPACSIVPQPNTLPRGLCNWKNFEAYF